MGEPNFMLTDETARLWICEKGHLDDHHLSVPQGDELCSRCGAKVTAYSAAQFIAENQSLRQQLAECNERKQELLRLMKDAPDVHGAFKAVTENNVKLRAEIRFYRATFGRMVNNKHLLGASAMRDEAHDALTRFSGAVHSQEEPGTRESGAELEKGEEH